MSHDPQPSSRLRSSLLRTGTDPVEAFRLVPFGSLPVEGHRHNCTFDRSQADALVEWFKQLGRRLAIDYEHQSFATHNARPDGLSPAAGWIGALEVRPDGLWAIDLDWTPKATELLRSGEYRYFSPVLIWKDARRQHIAALGPVALTNDPALHEVPALVADRDLPETLQAARREVTALQDELRQQRSERFLERGVRAGKILGTTRAEWEQLFLKEPRVAEQRLAQAPVLLASGQLVQPEAGNEPRLAGEWIEQADLLAYERVASAGYVRLQGDTSWH